jgi:transcriptional regulator GlxA family with amidase domain
MHHVVALALPKVVASQLSAAAQVFGHRDEQQKYNFTVCGRTPGPVESTTGFAVQPTAGLDALDTADTVIVPGFWPPDNPAGEALEALGRAASRGARMVSVCTGAFAFAAAGLLGDRAVTTHWQEVEKFAARFPSVDLRADVLYVDAGQFLSAAGDGAGVDLFLHVLRQDYGAAAADEVAGRMMIPVQRPSDHAQTSPRWTPDDHGGVAAACLWAVDNLQRPLTVAQLAEQARMALRTFSRQFLHETGLTPLRWLSAQRVLEARRLLETTDLTVDDIARRCGLGTAVNLRTHLARDADTTPSAYRRSFRRKPA